MYLPKDEMHINKFVDVSLPTKSQIFARTGQHAVSPAGSYSGDDSVSFGLSPTESAEQFAKAAETYEKSEDSK